MKLKKSFAMSFAGVIALAISVSAQADSKLKTPTTTPKQSGGNPAKLPPTVKRLFVPDLKLKGAESVEVNATVPKSYFKVVFSFQNWDEFPGDTLQPDGGRVFAGWSKFQSFSSNQVSASPVAKPACR